MQVADTGVRSGGALRPYCFPTPAEKLPGMCGICGIFEYSGEGHVERPLIETMASSIQHRGPDDAGFHVAGPIGLGFRRLSIIDLQGGHQPIPNEDSTCWLILNGEIYNYRELRQQLEAAGHRLRTQADSETIVHGYEEWGADVTNHLNGMFGFAVWDSGKRQLLLARDHLGIKPLYYHDNGSRLIFGSELKAILQDERVPRELDPQALDIFLRLGYLPSPWTLFKGIHKLPAGHRLLASAAGIEVERFWKSTPEIQHDIDEQQAIDGYAERFRRAVERQMVSDVPIGCLLSGGVDSAMVTAVMSELSDKPVKTFSIGFEEPGDWNELDDAAATSRLFRTEHHPIKISARDYLDFFAESFWYLEEPVLSQSTFAYYYLSKLARSHVKVVLTGQGADEPLAGYDRYRGEKLAAKIGWLAGSRLSQKLVSTLPRAEKLRRAARSLGERDPLERFTQIHTLFSSKELQDLLRPEIRAQMIPPVGARGPIEHLQQDVQHLDGLSQLLYIDTRLSLPDDLLFYGDKLSMANSLEARVPLLDYELVEYIESLPPSLKLRGMRGKYVHKQAARRWLPESVIHRRKKGFGTPVDAWFQSELDGFVRETLLSPDAACSELFQRPALERLLAEHRERRRDYRRHITALLSFELWHRRFLKSPVAKH